MLKEREGALQIPKGICKAPSLFAFSCSSLSSWTFTSAALAAESASAFFDSDFRFCGGLCGGGILADLRSILNTLVCKILEKVKCLWVSRDK